MYILFFLNQYSQRQEGPYGTKKAHQSYHRLLPPVPNHQTGPIYIATKNQFLSYRHTIKVLSFHTKYRRLSLLVQVLHLALAAAEAVALVVIVNMSLGSPIMVVQLLILFRSLHLNHHTLMLLRSQSLPLLNHKPRHQLLSSPGVSLRLQLHLCLDPKALLLQLQSFHQPKRSLVLYLLLERCTHLLVF